MTEERDEDQNSTDFAETSEGDQLSVLQKELETAKKDFLYLRAEFDNYRKNMIKERSDWVKFGSENLIRDLLNSLDVMEMAVAGEISASNISDFKKGFELVLSDFKSVLGRYGVKEENPAGKPFDPGSHEAVSSEVTNSVPPGHVARVFKKTYKLHDKVIRPAQVVVAASESNQ